MFKRLFGQPSGSTRATGRSGDGPGSTSTGRAAFDAVDKLKDVRAMVLFSSRFLSENPPIGNPKSFRNRDDTFVEKTSCAETAARSKSTGLVVVSSISFLAVLFFGGLCARQRRCIYRN